MNKAMRNSKKAFFMQLPTDIQGWFIFFVGILFWTAIFAAIKTDVKYEINQVESNLEGSDIFINILRTPVQNKNIADLAAEVYLGGDNNILLKEINESLNLVYGIAEPVCWTLTAGEKILAKVECTTKEEIFDAKTKIPLQNNKLIEIELKVIGRT